MLLTGEGKVQKLRSSYNSDYTFMQEENPV